MLGVSTGFVLGMTWSCVTSGNAYRLPDGVEARLALFEVEHVCLSMFPPAKKEPRAAANVVNGEFSFEASRQG